MQEQDAHQNNTGNGKHGQDVSRHSAGNGRQGLDAKMKEHKSLLEGTPAKAALQ
jgi:hypothetical protein